MKRLLAEAKWMDGAVWTLLMFAVFASVELIVLGARADAAFWTRQFVVWGLAGAGYAVLSGWLARRRAQWVATTDAAPQPAMAESSRGGPEADPEPVSDRAERRRAAREARKRGGRGD